MSAEGEPERPEYFILLRKLQSYAGRDGAIPLLDGGGYLDQPYIASKALEACISAEKKFELRMRIEQDGISTSEDR